MLDPLGRPADDGPDVNRVPAASSMRTVPGLLRRAVERAPDRTALIGPEREPMTYAQLCRAAEGVAGGLRNLGVAPGDRVVLCMANSRSWVVAYFGVLVRGAVVVPVNPRLTDPEIEHIVSDSGAAAVLRTPDDVPTGTPERETEPSPDDLAAICYTSGTTGRPKGAVFRHRQVTSGVEVFVAALADDGSARDGVVSLIAVPLFHAAGLLVQLLTTVRLSGTVVLMSRFDPVEALELIAEHRVESFLGVPAIMRALIDHDRFADCDTGSLTTVLYGAAPVPPELVLDLLAAFPGARLGNGYGSTESGNVSFLPHRDAASHPDSVGFPSPGTEVRLDEPDGGGVGELLVRGPQVMLGYWNRPDLDAEVFAEGYLRTGDLCRRDDDGRIYVVDRTKDLIIRGGENIYSVEVENALTGVDGVCEAGVVGVPDPLMGERVAAAVVIARDRAIDADELLAAARKLLADYKLPERLLIRYEPLPRNAGGKLLKNELRGLDGWTHIQRVSLSRRGS